MSCHREAVSSRSGVLNFYVKDDPVSNANTLINRGAAWRSVSVEAVQLDGLRVSPRVSVIKIDAEGAEVDVLEGGRTLIREDRPAIALDVHPRAIDQAGRSLSELCALIDELDLVPHLAGERVSSNWICEQRQIFDLQLTPA